MLRIEGLHVAYGEVAALRGIDLRVDAGEVVALVGANGAGKSTLLKTISGLCRPAAGTIRLLDEDVTASSPPAILERGVVHVPEGRRVFPRLTVEQNLLVGAYSDRAWRWRSAVLAEVYAMFPRLHERRRQAGASLSGGEQQMLAFGRAMMSRPRLLMLDEPSLGLAPLMVEEVAKAIGHFRAGGLTILLVEQNAELALSLATRAYVIEAGLVVRQGTGEELLDHPDVWASYLGHDVGPEPRSDAGEAPGIGHELRLTGEPGPAPILNPASEDTR